MAIEVKFEDVIIGRKKPSIYGFTVERVFPKHLKVGFTSRPVEERIDEWRKVYGNKDVDEQIVVSAMVDNNFFFMDHSVHQYLENHGKLRIDKEKFKSCGYPISSEFFLNAIVKDVEDAVTDINDSYSNNRNEYAFYGLNDDIVIPFSKEEWKLRDEQSEVVNKFVEKYKENRKKLLMFAAMRFGKTFTALSCATHPDVDAHFIVVVSAKTDVKNEWEHTIKGLTNFDGFDYLESKDLSKDKIDSILNSSSDARVLLFLSLQDLNGKGPNGELIKERLEQVFKKEIDVLIVDETHFGAWNGKYSQIIDEDKDKREDNDDEVDNLEDVENAIQSKNLTSKVQLHLSGTPYRLIYEGEFEDDDIICYFPYTKIVDAQKEWNVKHLTDDDFDESKNPYFGYPELVRFAFSFNKSSQELISKIKKETGKSTTLNDIFAPISLVKDPAKKYKKFIHEKEVLDIFKIFDGSDTDGNILSFLNYEAIKKGNMCRHIIIVLPYKASCDALEQLLKKNKSTFINLKDYSVLNISGLDSHSVFPDVQSIKDRIAQLDKRNIKTITLTCGRMLTGTTVRQWDTMIYLKSNKSPQEYDQSIFRLQSSNVITTPSDDGSRLTKQNLKPQTLLIDLDPERMYTLQQKRSEIYDQNLHRDGQYEFEKTLNVEMGVSPIFSCNSGKMVRVEPTDIVDLVSKYNSERTIIDEAKKLYSDISWLNDETIKNELLKQGNISGRGGLSGDTYTNGGSGDVDTGESDSEEASSSSSKTSGQGSSKAEEKDLLADLKAKESSYKARILFYSFITKSYLNSLTDLISSIDDGENPRIAKNLKLEKTILERIVSISNYQRLKDLNYAIYRNNKKSKDENIQTFDKICVSVGNFDRLSDFEVMTPLRVADEIVSSIDKDELLKLINSGYKIVDIASKSGEFTLALKKYLNGIVNDDSFSKIMYSIPTSTEAYEFTRKTYELLGLNVDHIATDIKATDLIESFDINKLKKFICREGEDDMKFGLIIGNPPYHATDGGGASDDGGVPIYNQFISFSKSLKPRYMSFVIPSKWMVGGRNLDSFRDEMKKDSKISKMVDYEDAKVLFKDIHLDGGACYFLWDDEHVGDVDYIFVSNDGSKSQSKTSLSNAYSDYVVRDQALLKILKKINSSVSFKNIVSTTRPYGIRNFLFNSPERYPDSGLSETEFNDSYKIYGVKGIKGGAKRVVGFVKRSFVNSLNGKSASTIKKYKILFTTSYSTNAINPPEPILAGPGEICTETFLVIGSFENKTMQKHCLEYINTKLFKFLLYHGKGTMHVTRDVFCYIPLIDFTERITDKFLYDKFGFSEDEIKLVEGFVDSKTR